MRKLGDKRKDFLDRAIGHSKFVIDTDKLDVRFFEEMKENNPAIKQTLGEAQADYEKFPELQQDIFSSLYKYKPHLLKEHQVNPTYLLNRAVMEDLVEAPKYKELRALTRLDKVNATVGTEILGDEAHEAIKKLKEQMEKFQKYLQALGEAQQAQEAQKESEGATNGTGQESKEGGGNAQGVQTPEELTVKEAQKKLEAAYKQFRQSMKKKEVQQSMRRMLDRVHERVVETSDMISHWGLDGDDTFTKMSYHEKMALLKRLRNSTKLKKIAELAGRLKRLATQRQREKVVKGMDEIYDISQGSDIGRLIPSELQKLQHPATKALFMKDFVEGRLLQYDLRGKEKKQKGAIVVCIDDSGSMVGDPEIWAKSVALALLEVAIYQKRNFYCIHFDHTRDPKKLHTNEFPKEAPYNIMEVLDLAEYFSGGGTLFEPALTHSRDLIDSEEDYKKADIIFITDGNSVVREGWIKEYNEWKDSFNVSIYGILVDARGNSEGSLKLFCNEIYKLSQFSEQTREDLAIHLFDEM